MTTSTNSSGNHLQLMMATGAFAICFAVFGSVSAMMPILKKSLGLNPIEVSIALAIPVLLGSLGRIPLGMLADRFGVLLLVWLAIFWLKAENAPRRAPAKSLSEVIKPLIDSRSWMLSLYYFLTFGGFVAMAIYLPTFLTDTFKLGPSDAGARTAGFVVLATLMRPVGGILADRIGGRKILLWVFPLTAVMAILLACPSIITCTVGAPGIAAAIGMGNGAVFKLAPEYFPHSVGAVTGLVGAAGGLGGFFPPLVLGAIRQFTGTFTLGFLLLSLFSLVCLTVVYKSGSQTNQPEPLARKDLEEFVEKP